MKKMLNICTMLLATVFLFSCVSSKKYKTAVAQADQLKAQNIELTNQVNSLNQQVTDLNNKNNAVTADYNKLKTSCADCQEQLAHVRAVLAEEVNTMAEVMEKLTAAMQNFKDKGVELYSRNGMIYVSMSEGLLYKSGSAKLGAAGIEALGQLASALNEYPKLRVIVVGNTDTMKVKGVADNWSLSTERANGVVRVLKDKYAVDPARLTAAGHGKFDPIESNETAEGRAKNRRTDIILNPDLDRIWEEAKAQKQ